MPTRIVVADDHQIVRQGLRAALEAAGDCSVVAEAGTGLEVPALVERLRPDVLILDLMMPGLNGLEVTRQVHRKHPGIKIVILSMHGTEAYVLEALEGPFPKRTAAKMEKAEDLLDNLALDTPLFASFEAAERYFCMLHSLPTPESLATKVMAQK